MENNTLCNRHSLGVNNHTKMYVTYTRIYGWSDYGGESSYQPGYRLENMMWMTLLVYDYIIPGEDIMRIAVTYENGQIFQHFGHTETFKIYDVEEGKVLHSEVVDTNGSGHGALAGVLNALNADVLICGGIGGGAQTALAAAGIKLFGGVSGDADKAVEAFINDTLDYNPDVKCSHHEHNHGEGHTCGEHGCGSHSCH